VFKSQNLVESTSDKEKKRSYSPPQKLTSPPDSQRNNPNNQSKTKMPSYLNKVNSKIKDMVNHHKKLKNVYEKFEKTKKDDQKYKEEMGFSNTSDEDNHVYAEYLSNSKNYLSSQKFRDVSSWNEEEKNEDDKLKKENLTEHAKSPTFVNVESQYIEKEMNNEPSQFKPKMLEFEKLSNYSSNLTSNLNTRYNNFHNNNNNNNYNNYIDNGEDLKKKSNNNFNDLKGVKKEQSKIIGEQKEFKYTGGF